MPNPGAERPLRKVTLNLFEDDCIYLEGINANGWTVAVRSLVHAGVRQHQHQETTSYHVIKRTLGDLE